MKRGVMPFLVLLVAVVFMLTPVISGAVPGNGKGDGNAGGNGNHYGWGNGDGNQYSDSTGATYDTPEPSTLLELAFSLVALQGVWLVMRKRPRKGWNVQV
jgi:hypothetical protein